MKARIIQTLVDLSFCLFPLFMLLSIISFFIEINPLLSGIYMGVTLFMFAIIYIAIKKDMPILPENENCVKLDNELEERGL